MERNQTTTIGEGQEGGEEESGTSTAPSANTVAGPSEQACPHPALKRLETVERQLSLEEDIHRILRQRVQNMHQNMPGNTQKVVKDGVEFIKIQLFRIEQLWKKRKEATDALKEEVSEMVSKAKTEKTKRAAPPPPVGPMAQESKGKRKRGGTGSDTPSPPPARNDKRKKAASTEAAARTDGHLNPQDADPPWVEVGRKGKTGGNKKHKKKRKKGEIKKDQARKPGSHGIRVRPEAVLVVPGIGATYAEMVARMKARVDVEKLGIDVRSIRRTRAGGVLVELGKNSKEKKDELVQAIGGALGEDARVGALTPFVTLEVRDVEETVTEEEVRAAVESHYVEEPKPEIRVRLSRTNIRGTKLAMIGVSAAEAGKLISLGTLKLGWCSCHMRVKVSPDRCFRCQGFGHRANGCKNVDRATACWRCGKEGHRAAECKKDPHCPICAERSLEASHALRSTSCPGYITALAAKQVSLGEHKRKWP